MDVNTHLEINQDLCGKVTRLEENFAQVELTTTEVMRADSRGLVHGSFAFGAADYCAMVVVNDPNVVLANAQTKFTAPVKVGQVVVFEGTITENNGKKNIVQVVGKVDDKVVLDAVFKTVILDKHVFDI
jgi:acyl-coenzyme A thioesterase PaaI-like protein